MKKATVIVGTLLVGAILTGCGQAEEAEKVEQLKQTGILTDYSSDVSLGNYKGYEIAVSSAEVTDADVDTLIQDILFNYYSLASSDGSINYVWDDKTAAEISGGKYTTTESYEQYRRDGMKAELEKEQKKEFIDGIWLKIMEGSTFTGIDDAAIKTSAEDYYISQKANYEYYASYYGYDYEEYLQEKQGMTDEEFHDKCYEYVLTEKQRVMASSAIFYSEGMTLTDEEFSKGVAELLDNYSGYASSAEFVSTFGEDYIREYLVSKKVDEYLAGVNTMIVQ